VLTTAAENATEAVLASAMLGGDGNGDGNATTTRTANVRATAAGIVNAPSLGRSIAPVLATEAVSVRDAQGVERVRAATMHVAAGEIVGIAAVEGSGQSQLLRVLAGRMQASEGTVTRPDVVGFVPEDRHRDALLLEQSLVENIALRGAGARRGLVAWSGMRTATVAVVQRFDVRTSSVASAARTLSGGNQQKLVLGRELDGAPSALVVENPSRGLDFLATAAVRDALRAARDAGAAVLVYSSDLDEVLELADRIYAMHQGRLTETARDRDQVGRAMLGSATDVTTHFTTHDD
jgi:simple sugar transport system ATP-binding protein